MFRTLLSYLWYELESNLFHEINFLTKLIEGNLIKNLMKNEVVKPQ